jgi:hypothetical protein
MLSTGLFTDLALGTGGKRVPLDWSLADEHGNTALHWLFSGPRRTKEWGDQRPGAFVQEFALALCRDTAAAKAVLSRVDLLAANNEGKSAIRLIADHCLHPRSRRRDTHRQGYHHYGLHWPEWGDPIMPPERFPNCLHAHEKLYTAWMAMRAPLVKSVVSLKFRPPPSLLLGKATDCC